MQHDFSVVHVRSVFNRSLALIWRSNDIMPIAYVVTTGNTKVQKKSEAKL